ncbi:MAG: hypothetical protein RL701_5303 [Pseudomonadota bacterium]
MLPYAVTTFLSAFLLFIVQPLIARQILPWFGGAAAVWTTCLLFFQSVLLAGYAYTHASVRWLRPRQQVYVHCALLLASLFILPIAPDPAWKPIGHEDPVARILGLLAVTIGVPYWLLSTTTPLVQAWYWRRFESNMPYRLFALSNLASLVALFGYPLVAEPYVGVAACARAWSYAYGIFVLFCIGTGLHSLRRVTSVVESPSHVAEPAVRVPLQQLLRWLLFASTGTFVLLAVSNHITQNIAAVPFLWVLPLALYLLTFIICFDKPQWYVRGVFWPLLSVAVVAMVWHITSVQLPLVAPLFAAGLFVACMFCHGELARLRPAPQHLTLYYLIISAGGALGALCLAIGAPLLLRGYFEMHAVLALLALLLIGCVWRLHPLLRVASVAVLIGVLWLDGKAIKIYTARLREMERDFYGVVRVRDWHGPPRMRVMFHGGINHGGQYLEPGRTMEPTCYVGLTSGYGRLLRAFTGPKKVGVLGLGAGALMTYARPGDSWVFYEIDPLVVKIAARQFSFQREANTQVEHVLGDGRLALEREPSRAYDVLAIDAFSGDAVPMHLLTREAMAAYVKHLKPDGAIVFQATNRFVDLLPVIRRLADEVGMQTLWIDDEPDLRKGYFSFGTDQVIVTRNAQLLQSETLRGVGKPAPVRADLPTFTDDFHNVTSILKR